MIKEGVKSMLKSVANRAKFVVSGEKGASNLEFLGFAVLALIIISALFLLGDEIVGWLKKATSRIGGFQTGNEIKGTNTGSTGGFEG